MGTLGTYLRNAREARGLDLRDAAQQTRIGYAYLQAIEREDFTKLPGEVFVKGFLRNYAKFLRVPDDEVLRLYAELKLPPAPAGAAQDAAPQNPAKHDLHKSETLHDAVPLREETVGVERYVWAAVALVLLIAALFVALPERQAGQKDRGAELSSVGGAEPLASAPTPTARPEKLYLDVTALGDLWVLVRTDSSPQKKAVLKKGETVTWSADERFLLSIGNAAAARILMNGKELILNVPVGMVVRDIAITAKGMDVPKSGFEKPRPRKPKPVAVQPPQEPVPAPAPSAPADAPVAAEVPAPAPAAVEPVAPAPQPLP